MDNTNPSMPPVAPVAPVAAAPAKKDIRISLTSLPAGVKAGDKIELTVSGVDEATKTATLLPQAEDDSAEPEGDEPEEGEKEPEVSKENLNTKTLLGPMDGLKNYLVQKSMDVPKNQGRS